MKRLNTPRFAQILNWLEGKLPEEEMQSVTEALAATDKATQADLEWLRMFLLTSKEVHLASPPAKVKEISKHRFAEYATTYRPLGFIQHCQAMLTFDSRGQVAAAGLRSASTESLQQQLIYSTEIAEVVMNVQWLPQDKRFNLIGQVFPLADIPPAAFSIQILQNSVEVGITTADELGEFIFEGLARGEYEMILCVDQIELLIPSFHIQP